MIVDLIFNILNFLLFIAIAVFIFYKYLLKNILKAFNEDKLNHQILIEQSNDLHLFEEKLNQSITNQEIIGKNLALKIEKWRSYVENQKSMLLADYNKNYNQIKNKLAIQHNNYQNSKIQKQIEPQLIEHLENEINNYFKDQSNLDQYFDNIFNNKLKFKDYE